MKNNFDYVAAVIQQIAKERGYNFPSAIIAQAIVESDCGGSLLSSKYFNYFGMKCGKGWKGKSVKLKTREEYTPGTLTNIYAKFRAYDSVLDGIKGYFNFIEKYSRYSNLKEATSPEDYIIKLKNDGWATSLSYITTLADTLNTYKLREYDNFITPIIGAENVEEVTENEKRLAEDVIRGKYGNGIQRKDNIYKAIQRAVNLALSRS